jgi:hypothetical protein
VLLALTEPVTPVLAQNVYAVFECYNICDSDYWAKKLGKRECQRHCELYEGYRQVFDSEEATEWISYCYGLRISHVALPT